MQIRFLALALALDLANGFSVNGRSAVTRRSHRDSVIGSTFRSPVLTSHPPSKNSVVQEEESSSLWRRFANRFDTIRSAGIEDAKVAGVGDKLKGLHGPITYLALGLLAGLKWKWCFRNPYFWFAMAFCVKWYRARYVFKIPVWDRQPNWNNIITSKEQEKDLKAFTCKKCGSTLFIAKTREFFFEGDTGIGGLGCFSCGAKGKENFVQDRDRIVDDVADMDDYFEYERPLDFVSRAERRKLLKETGGDEEAANQLLVDRSGTDEPVDTPAAEDAAVKGSDEEVEEEVPASESVEEEVVEEAVEDTPTAEETKPEIEASAAPEPEPEAISEPKVEKPKKKKKKAPKQPVQEASDDDFDVLGMDDF